MRWKECWIWLFQAALFMLGHIYYLGTYNYSFWIIAPLSGLILGLLAWRTRSIGTSMIAHGIVNALGNIVAHYAW
jgi:membrane protease YdiL (CAAX protease family)